MGITRRRPQWRHDLGVEGWLRYGASFGLGWKLRQLFFHDNGWRNPKGLQGFRWRMGEGVANTVFGKFNERPRF